MTSKLSKRMTIAALLLTVLFAGGTAGLADTQVQLTFGSCGHDFEVKGCCDLDLGDDWSATIQVNATNKIVTRPTKDLQVWIWPDRGEGGDYRPGDDISMYVEANRDCYLILYNIDTQGRLNILFPYDPWSDNFVRGGQTVRFPRQRDDLDWTVEGPPGVEYVQAIASTYPINPPDWPVYIRSVNGRDAISYDRGLNDFNAYDDRLAYIRVVNRKITKRHWDYCATDMATFNVRQRRHWRQFNNYDPWPEAFYGEIYIGWPVGGAIYVDNIFIGHAPLRIPRRHWGRYEISCRVGNRVVRSHHVRLYPKREYRYHRPAYGKVDVRARGHVKLGKRGQPKGYRVPERRKSHSGTLDHNRRDRRNKRHTLNERLGRDETRPRKQKIVRTGKTRTKAVDRIRDHRTKRGVQSNVTRKLAPAKPHKAKRSKLSALGGALAKIGKSAAKRNDRTVKAGKTKREKKADQKSVKRIFKRKKR
jgi:hypothetical protein